MSLHQTAICSPPKGLLKSNLQAIHSVPVFFRSVFFLSVSILAADITAIDDIIGVNPSEWTMS